MGKRAAIQKIDPLNGRMLVIGTSFSFSSFLSPKILSFIFNTFSFNSLPRKWNRSKTPAISCYQCFQKLRFLSLQRKHLPCPVDALGSLSLTYLCPRPSLAPNALVGLPCLPPRRWSLGAPQGPGMRGRNVLWHFLCSRHCCQHWTHIISFHLRSNVDLSNPQAPP